ncbi:MAG TPA: alpha/beta fold hydrolase, partial [Burkholderiaceae bacterium]
MTADDDTDRGLRRRREMLGDEWVQRATANATDFNADFQAFITRYAWHEVWNRPGLPDETRRLLVLGMTMAQGRWEEFELHCGAAVRGGVSAEKIKETLLQGAIYCGVPAANTAFKLAQQILIAEGRAPQAAPLTDGVRGRQRQTFSRPALNLVEQGEGAGVPIVFAHALGMDLHWWDRTAAVFAAAGHPTLRYDQRGHGLSEWPDEGTSMDLLALDAARLIDEWGRGPVVFVGLSLGGMVAQGLALARPELVRGLVLAHTTARYASEGRAAWEQRIQAIEAGGMAAIADMVVERNLNAAYRAARPEHAQALKQHLLKHDTASYLSSCAAVRDVDWLDRL